MPYQEADAPPRIAGRDARIDLNSRGSGFVDTQPIYISRKQIAIQARHTCTFDSYLAEAEFQETSLPLVRDFERTGTEACCYDGGAGRSMPAWISSGGKDSADPGNRFECSRSLNTKPKAVLC